MQTADKALTKSRLSLREALAVVDEICAAFHLDGLLPQINALKRSLGESRAVNVAVVGRFKAGKSSFLNQIIGRD
ncbi:MAG: dynamin family protein, partial [Thermoleophilia bacterium]|nr:dynamin family protein [Thermoleophilia bacterium]